MHSAQHRVTGDLPTRCSIQYIYICTCQCVNASELLTCLLHLCVFGFLMIVQVFVYGFICSRTLSPSPALAGSTHCVK